MISLSEDGMNLIYIWYVDFLHFTPGTYAFIFYLIGIAAWRAKTTTPSSVLYVYIAATAARICVFTFYVTIMFIFLYICNLFSTFFTSRRRIFQVF